jgi:hypothetical protein
MAYLVHPITFPPMLPGILQSAAESYDLECERLRSTAVRYGSGTTWEWLLAQALAILTGEEGGKARCY